MKYKFVRTKAAFEIFLVVTLSIFVSLSLSTKEVAADNGCCAVGEQCSSGVTLETCTSRGGDWDPGLCSEGVNVAKCIKGCCAVGNNAFLTPANEGDSSKSEVCESFDGVYNPDINSADACSGLVARAEEGCCVDGDNYRFSARGSCNGIFYKDTVCNLVAGYEEADYTSHSEARCGPSGTAKAGDVYWYDSAGNLEEIKEDCNSNDVSRSMSVCNEVDGEYKCKSLDCETTWDNPAVEGDGGYRKNGESWCEYQAAVGPGMDLPGTQHFVHRCENGREIVEPCDSDRSTICVYNKIDYGSEYQSYKKVTQKRIDNIETKDWPKFIHASF